MTNKELITNWRNLGIKFKSSKEIKSLNELFLICVGESEIDVGGKKELVVAFFQGYDDKEVLLYSLHPTTKTGVGLLPIKTELI